ncbi:MAG: hypothetical protein H3C38_11175 [Rhodospirillales bacterium]|nr:hypothetical protein [Rhodospirillales bacterium]
MEKRLFFTVTPGRSGTNYLAELLHGIPGITALHEPEPNFVHVLRRVQQDPTVAHAFLRDHKLPAISKVETPAYLETSHLTCKGFIEPLLRLGMAPGLIILRRPPREVAWSLLERRTVPARTPAGMAYLLEPRDPYVLPLPGWERLSDYHLCFWYALEIERRQLRYTQMAAELGLPVVDLTNRELNALPVFAEVLAVLGIEATDQVRARHAQVSGKVHNPNSVRQQPPDNLDELENDVWNRVADFEPLLAGKISERYARGTAV